MTHFGRPSGTFNEDGKDGCTDKTGRFLLLYNPQKMLDSLLLKGSSVKCLDAFRMALTEEPE